VKGTTTDHIVEEDFRRTEKGWIYFIEISMIALKKFVKRGAVIL
jgi:hypothetical protein